MSNGKNGAESGGGCKGYSGSISGYGCVRGSKEKSGKFLAGHNHFCAERGRKYLFLYGEVWIMQVLPCRTVQGEWQTKPEYTDHKDHEKHNILFCLHCYRFSLQYLYFLMWGDGCDVRRN